MASGQAYCFQPPSSKMEIVSLLAARHNVSRYLELCTPTTGTCYGQLDRRLLMAAHRLMYNCPDDFDDGLAIDFRSTSHSITECLAEIGSRGLRYDIILVDPYHEYETSHRDLSQAFRLIDDGGFLVVHDCLPLTAEVATPTFKTGAWCGVTYKAYLDFVSVRPDLDYRTVDVDYGCGVVRKLQPQSSWMAFARTAQDWWLTARADERHRQQRLLWRQWRENGRDFDRSFQFFDAHKERLLKLVSREEFLAYLQDDV